MSQVALKSLWRYRKITVGKHWKGNVSVKMHMAFSLFILILISGNFLSVHTFSNWCFQLALWLANRRIEPILFAERKINLKIRFNLFDFKCQAIFLKSLFGTDCDFDPLFGTDFNFDPFSAPFPVLRFYDCRSDRFITSCDSFLIIWTESV